MKEICLREYTVIIKGKYSLNIKYTRQVKDHRLIYGAGITVFAENMKLWKVFNELSYNIQNTFTLSMSGDELIIEHSNMRIPKDKVRTITLYITESLGTVGDIMKEERLREERCVGL